MNLFDIKNKIDNSLYDVFNIISDFLYYFKFSTKKYVKKNERFLNKHLDSRCFIVGTGPSINLLKNEEINLLKNEHIFAVNSYFKIESLVNVKPKYYALVDDLFWREKWVFGFKEILDVYKDEDIKIITDYRAKSILDRLNFTENTIFLHSKRFPSSKIKYDISRNVDVGINVVSYCILSAIYMGYKQIYLLGCDYNSFATLTDEHCYNDSNEQYEIKDRLGMLLSFFYQATRIHYLIRDLSIKKDVEIINLTPGSLLDAYPRLNISDILK